LPKES